MSGSVTLVGAGCGKDLITVKGLRALQQAEVLVYDDLIDPSLLLRVPPSCEMIYAGKRSGRHSETQEAINRLLIEKAKSGKSVVRLKGGDSFVFGRGGEEMLALRDANVPCEVIPGVSSAIAVAERFGIPVTHRGAARSFTVVTGHGSGTAEESYEALAKLDGTLVFLMPLGNLNTICEKLMACGKDENTPAAILSKGFSGEEKRIDGALADIGEKSALAETPAILVIGRTAGFSLRSTLFRPLDGVSVAVTGTDSFTRKLEEPLVGLGADVIRLPLLEPVPDPAAIPADLSPYTWLLFASSNGVDIFFNELKARQTDFRALAHLQFACVGSGTAGSLREQGFSADFVPEEFSAEALGRELAPRLSSADRLLLLRGEGGSPRLPELLRRQNIPFEDIPIYAARQRQLPGALASLSRDYIVFASTRGVDAFFRQGGRLKDEKPVCIGALTAERLRQYTDKRPMMPNSHTTESIVTLILEDQA